jgi:hypothetical protein
MEELQTKTEEFTAWKGNCTFMSYTQDMSVLGMYSKCSHPLKKDM